MIRSFRLRIALASALLTGLVLGVFAANAWWLIRSVKVEHADALLLSHAEREAGRPPRAFNWSRVDDNIAGSLGMRTEGDLALIVLDDQGKVVYQSEGWPGGLSPSRLPWPTPPAREPIPTGESSLPPGNEQPPESEDRPPSGINPPPSQNDRRPPRSPREWGKDPGRDEDGAAWRPPPRGPRPVAILHLTRADGDEWRIGLASTDRGRVAVALATRTIAEDMRGIGAAFLIAIPIALLLAGMGAWVISGSALRPIRKLTAAAQRVTATGLDQRIAAGGEDREFGQLVDVFNGMLERLQRSFEQAYRFSGDAAHELKTPLAILQGQVEHAINSAEPGSAVQEALTGILDEVRRLSTISRKLLLLSQADAGKLNVYREPFALSEALAGLAEDARMLAPHLKVTADIPPDITISADSSLLKQVLHNLISNAIKYNLEDGWIRITLSAPAAQVKVALGNASLGIPPREQERIFERFYRADAARNRRVEGVGLGLTLAREIARAHGGDLSCAVGNDGSVDFVLTLPRNNG